MLPVTHSVRTPQSLTPRTGRALQTFLSPPSFNRETKAQGGGIQVTPRATDSKRWNSEALDTELRVTIYYTAVKLPIRTSRTAPTPKQLESSPMPGTRAVQSQLRPQEVGPLPMEGFYKCVITMTSEDG